jgi:hypothetical protein
MRTEQPSESDATTDLVEHVGLEAHRHDLSEVLLVSARGTRRCLVLGLRVELVLLLAVHLLGSCQQCFGC